MFQTITQKELQALVTLQKKLVYSLVLALTKIKEHSIFDLGSLNKQTRFCGLENLNRTKEQPGYSLRQLNTAEK